MNLIPDERKTTPTDVGFVYVAINDSMPDLVKIGMTCGSVQERMKELSAATGVAKPFSCPYFCEVQNPQKIEEQLHNQFGFCRENERREFFRIDWKAIKAALEMMQKADGGGYIGDGSKTHRSMTNIIRSKNNLSPNSKQRIYKVRRDMGSMLFHFTRSTENLSACRVLEKILKEGKLKGTSRPPSGQNCVSFTESPIQEFGALFSMNMDIKYAPYGIGVSKKWLFEQGGRHVIYDSSHENISESQLYRWVEYDINLGIDNTWEREWVIKTDFLKLDCKQALVVVPTSEEAFDLMYNFSEIDADYHESGDIENFFHAPKWLCVSLDLFGFDYMEYE